MICKLIHSVDVVCILRESPNHFCIFLAITKYMDELLEKTLIEAMESNSAQVKLATHEQVSCTVPEADDTLTEGHFLLKQQDKRGGARPPTIATNGHKETPCAPSNSHSTRNGCSQHSQRENRQKCGLPISSENGQHIMTKPRFDESGNTVTPCGVCTNSKDQHDAT